VGLGLALAVLLAVGLVLLRRRRRPADERPLSPVELAEREFQALEADDPLARGDVKGFYVELTAIVRRYIERRTGIRAPEQTTQEFLRAMQTGASIPTAMQERLAAFLESADLVKFAALEPAPEDIGRSRQRAREFVGLESAA
jgi:hypothetical protein